MSSLKKIDLNGDDALLALLLRAAPEDLGLFVDYITDKGKGRMALANDVCATLVAAKASGGYSPSIVASLIRELQRFGGNSVANLFRNNGVPYSAIVFDVLDHLKGKRGNDESIADIEANILKKLWDLTLNGVTKDQRAELLRTFEANVSPTDTPQQGAGLGLGAVTPAIAHVLSGAMASSTFGIASGSASASLGFATSRAVGAALGPIALALSGIWGTYSLTKPAYRVTVACVVLIACIRLKLDV